MRPTLGSLKIRCLYLFFCMSCAAFGAVGDQSQSFTLEGELYNSPTGTTPLQARQLFKSEF